MLSDHGSSVNQNNHFVTFNDFNDSETVWSDPVNSENGYLSVVSDILVLLSEVE